MWGWVVIGIVVWVVLFVLRPLTHSKHSTVPHDKKPGPTFFKNSQGLWIYTHRVFPPKTQEQQITPIIGRIFSAHGFGGHSQRNYDLINHCVSKGFIWFALDHQGFGRSQGDRGYVEKFSHYIDDFAQFIDVINAEFPQHAHLPTFFVGASMGGAIGIEYMNRVRGKGFNGTLLLAPAIRPDPATAKGWMTVAAKYLSVWLPKAAPISMKPAQGCSVPDAVKEYEADPLVYCRPQGMRARWGQEMLDAMQRIQDNVKSVEWPYIIYQGTSDFVTNMGGVTFFHENTRSKDKHVEYLEGWYHALVEEPNKYQLYSMMTDWMTKRL